jgi:hypothetical protein
MILVMTSVYAPLSNSILSCHKSFQAAVSIFQKKFYKMNIQTSEKKKTNDQTNIRTLLDFSRFTLYWSRIKLCIKFYDSE